MKSFKQLNEDIKPKTGNVITAPEARAFGKKLAADHGMSVMEIYNDRQANNRRSMKFWISRGKVNGEERTVDEYSKLVKTFEAEFAKFDNVVKVYMNPKIVVVFDTPEGAK